MKCLILLVFLASCSIPGGGEEVKLSHRSRDAGPAVIVVDRTPQAAGPTLDEREPNDFKAGGQPLPLHASMRGRIDAAGDSDVYDVTVERSGTLSARLSAVDDADLVLEVLSDKGEVMAASDNGPAKTAEAIPNLYVQPGIVRLQVREFVKKPEKKGKKPPAGRAVPSQPYLLTVELGPPPEPGDEHEPNDAAAFADELSLGAAGRGYLGSKKDVDFWKLALDGMKEDDALAIDVDGVPEVALKLAVLDATGNALAARRGRTGESVALRSLALQNKTGTVFVVVSGDRANPDTPYLIKVTAAPLQIDEENEPNDAPDKANPLSDLPGAASGTRIGSLGAGDVDFYRLEPGDGARLLSVVVEPPGAVDVELTVTDPTEKPLGGPADAGKRGATERLDSVPIPKGTAALVRVRTVAGGSDSDRYKLRWSIIPASEPSVIE